MNKPLGIFCLFMTFLALGLGSRVAFLKEVSLGSILTIVIPAVFILWALYLPEFFKSKKEDK